MRAIVCLLLRHLTNKLAIEEVAWLAHLAWRAVHDQTVIAMTQMALPALLVLHVLEHILEVLLFAFMSVVDHEHRIKVIGVSAPSPQPALHTDWRNAY